MKLKWVKLKAKNREKRKLMKFSGIRRRWMLNGVATVLVAVLIGLLAFSISVSSYFYSTVQTGLVTKAKTATDFFANYITKTYAEYYDSAYRYIETFGDSSKLELQFINTDGSVEISSYGITAGTAPGTQDISQAIETGEISIWSGDNKDTGEHIMAVSAPIVYSNGQTIGVMRYITSLKLVDHQIMLSILGAVGVGAAIMLLIVMTNLVFIRSVVTPVNEITHVAKRIAEGSYGIQISKKYKDEIGEMVDAINEMSMKISQYEKTQTEFISSVSHELRTPLTAITGWGETLMYDETLDKDTRRGIEIILKEARRLTKMVEELLEFTRMQDGRFTLNIEQMDVVAELEDSIFAYRELLKQEDMQIEYTPPEEEIPLISGDPARLRQVFLNILDNAAKYGREGKKIKASVDADNSYVTIRIRDWGPGVPKDELENVKMKFYKGSSKERGSGIGLAVCDEIVKYHGGTLQLSNAEDGGLIVTIRLSIEPV